MKDFIKSKINEFLNIDESNIVSIEKVSPDADEITRNTLFPIVKDIYRGINKLKRGEYDSLSEEEKDIIISLFPDIIDKDTNFFNKKFEITDRYKIPQKFFKLYKVKTLDGKSKKVSVGFYYDKKDDDIAYYEDYNMGIAINMAKVDMNQLNQLESTIRHELIHSADPKVTKKRLNKRIKEKEKVYDNLFYEFDSFSHEFITTIYENLNLIEDKELKNKLIISLWKLISHLDKGFSADFLYNRYIDKFKIIRLFSKNGLTSNNKRGLRNNFFNFLTRSSNWVKTKDSVLFDRFKSRLVRYVPYIHG